MERVADGKVHKQGALRAAGYYDPFAGPRERWGRGKYEIALLAEDLQVSFESMARGRLDANLMMRGMPGVEQEDRIAGEIKFSRAKVGIPAGGTGGEISWRPGFSPYLDVQVRVEDLEVSTRTARVEFVGEGIIGGRLGYEPLAVGMKFNSKRGALDFPTAVAEVQKMEVTVSKKPEETLYAFGHVEATARVGRHKVDLTGGGMLFPHSELRIVANATPPLPETQAAALLLGIPATVMGAGDGSAQETLGQRVAESLSSSVTTMAAAGVSAPLLKASGLNELSFAISPMSTRLQLGKRLAERVYIYYLSSLGGASRTSLLRFIFDITPDLSVGFSVNELEQQRYEIQTTKGF
jgi:hypothetical protein